MSNGYNEMSTIAAIVADELGQNVNDMFSMTRKRSVVYARQIFHYFCKKYLQETLETIGKFSEVMGRPHPHDHATVLHGHRSTKDLMTIDRVYKRKIEKIEERVIREILDPQADTYLKKTKTSIVEDIFIKEHMEFISKLKELVYKLSRDKNIKDLDELLKYQERKENGRIRETAQSYSSVGVV